MKSKNVWIYENIKIYKYGNMQICMEKNINVKNVKECVYKVNIYIYIYTYIYIKNYKVTSNRNVNKGKNKQNKEKI